MQDKSVLIIGPNYYNFPTATKKAFEELGWHAEMFLYDNPIHPYNLKNKILWKIGNKKKLLNKSIEIYSKAVSEYFDLNTPSFVFILNGDMLTPECIEHFKSKRVRVALWLFDAICKMPQSEIVARHTDNVFSFDNSDVEYLNDNGIHTEFLPQACDTSTYFPIPCMTKDIDILFIGNLYNSPRRKEIMLAVIKAFPNLKIEVYGLYQPWYKGIYKWLTRPYKKIFKNKNLSPEKVNEYYNRAKIVLNIHQESQKNGANPRVFEICGAGAYQICDRNPYIEELFPDECIDLYGSTPELINIIKNRISDTSIIRKKSMGIINSAHTYINLIRKVINNNTGNDD